jgi:RNA polymerase sigma-70 factor (ECF subfamily)
MEPSRDDRSDAELLRASDRDAEAFGLLYDRHARAVLGYLVRRTASAEDAADLAAETFAAAFLARKRYVDTGAPFVAWLIGIARRELLASLRRQRIADRARRKLGIPRLELESEELRRIEELAEIGQLREQLDKALDRLPSGMARAVSLRVAGELPYAEIARRLGCSEGAARVRVARGLTRLADLMEAT